MAQEKVGFVVDSSVGLYGSEIENDHILQVYFNVVDEHDQKYLDDNKVLTREFIINQLQSKNSFKTSAVSPGPVIEAVEKLLTNHDKVLVLTASSGLSSYYDNVLFLEEEYPNQVFVVDTKEIGYGIKILLQDVQTQLNSGVLFSEVLAYCQNFYKNNYTAFTCKNWTHLVKGGRAPAILSKLLNAFKTKPIIHFYIKNKLGGIAKSADNVVDKIIRAFKKMFNNPQAADIDYVVFYNNQFDPLFSQLVKDKLLSSLNIPQSKIIETFVPNLVLLYTAEGSFGFHIRCSKIIAKVTNFVFNKKDV